MAFCTKKSCTYITIGVFFMLNGIEYAVIFPTLWLYIHERFDAPGYMMGVIVAAFSVTGIFAGPAIGKWADKTRNTKCILLFANMWEIGGNIMYFTAFSTWFIVASRLVCGVGSAAGAAVIADISRGTSEAERTSMLSKVMAARQFGLFIGPSFNFFLREFNFSIGPFHIDAYTAPGLFLACVWSLHQLLVLFLYFNLEQLHSEAKCEVTATHIDYTVSDSSPDITYTSPLLVENDTGETHYGSIQVPCREEQVDDGKELTFSTSYSGSHESLTDSSRAIESAERLMSGASNHTEHGLRHSASPPSTTTPRTHSWYDYVHIFVREEIVLLLFLMFITFFNQVALETLLTPLTYKFFNWTELENSVLYSLCAVELLIMFFFIGKVSYHISDRHIILFGVFGSLAGMVWDLVFIPPAFPGQQSLLIYFIVGVILLLSSLPCLITASISLYSKLTSHEMQGLTHGVRRSFLNIAFILGPLWGGVMLDRLFWLFAINTGLIVLVLLMVLASFRRLSSAVVPIVSEERIQVQVPVI